jgi:hypothetical protein
MHTDTAMLQEMHALVWRYRSQLEAYWPTPTQRDALLFAFTEVAEAIDAELRNEPHYARNNDKTLSVADELADAAMMLLTALGPSAKPPSRLFVGESPKIEEYCYLMGKIIYLGIVDRQDVVWKREAWHLVSAIAKHEGIDLLARLESRLQRIRDKHMRIAALLPRVQL